MWYLREMLNTIGNLKLIQYNNIVYIILPFIEFIS
jgi:hypothetical protein